MSLGQRKSPRQRRAHAEGDPAVCQAVLVMWVERISSHMLNISKGRTRLPSVILIRDLSIQSKYVQNTDI